MLDVQSGRGALQRGRGVARRFGGIGSLAASAKVPSPANRSAIAEAPASASCTACTSASSPSSVACRKLRAERRRGRPTGRRVAGCGSYMVSGPRPRSTPSRADHAPSRTPSAARSRRAGVRERPSAARPPPSIRSAGFPRSASAGACRRSSSRSGATRANSSGRRMWHSRMSMTRCDCSALKPNSTAPCPTFSALSVARRRLFGGDR